MIVYQDGDLIGEYRVGGVIGRGSASDVYLAERPTGGQVAIKVYRAPGISGPAERTLGWLRTLAHPNIIRVFEWFLDDEDRLCLVQELATHGSLEDLLNRVGILPEPEARRLAMDLARALEHAHAAGVIHRDLKPSNVLLVGDTFKLVDFDSTGLLNVETSTTNAGEISGTPRYMSPEQLSGARQSETSDVFGLGLMLHQANYGFVPGEEDTSYAALVRTRLTQQIVVPPGPFQALISACVALDPLVRPPATQVLAWLARPQPSSPHQPSSQPQPTSPVTQLPSPRPAAPQQPLGTPTVQSYSGSGGQSPAAQLKWLVGAGLAGVVILVAVSVGIAAGFTRVFSVAGPLLLGGAIVALGVVAARQLRRRIPDHDATTERQAANIVFGVEDKGDLTDSLYAEAASVVAKLETPDATFLGLTIHAMISEFHQSQDSSDRQEALLNALRLMEKVQQRLSPWHVRNRDSLALGVTVAGGAAGLVSAIAGIFA